MIQPTASRRLVMLVTRRPRRTRSIALPRARSRDFAARLAERGLNLGDRIERGTEGGGGE